MQKMPRSPPFPSLPKTKSPSTSTKAHFTTPPANSSSYHPDTSLISSTNLIKAHCDRGALAEARHLLDRIPNRDVVAWTAMISGYAFHGRRDSSWAAFRDMLADCVGPNAHTLSSVLKACKGSKDRAMAAHCAAVKQGLEAAAHVQNALLDAYAASSAAADGGGGDAVKVFEGMAERNVVAWTTMIAAHVRWGDGHTAIRMFQCMIREGGEWNAFTSSIAIRAGASVDDLTLGRQLHAIAAKAGHETSLPVANSLVDLYSRCNSLSEAKLYFRCMSERDSVTWNAMIAGLDRSGCPEALHLLPEMLSQSIRPSSFTFTSVVSACGRLAVLNFGQQVHGTVIRRGFASNQRVANALVNMYTKCGCMVDSEKIFNEMARRDLVSWTSMMVGYGVNGFGKEAMGLFEEMVRSGVRPDSVVFTGLLSACSHAGLVEEGLKYFDSMSAVYGVRPEKGVLGCVVDLLGRAGRVAEAYGLIETMEFEPDESIWGALLGACRLHKNAELGALAAQRIVDLKPDDNGAKTYVMLSNIYAAREEWGKARDVRRLMRGAGRRKEVGRSWVEVKGEVWNFVAGESSSSCVGLAYEVVEMMIRHMDEEFMFEKKKKERINFDGFSDV